MSGEIVPSVGVLVFDQDKVLLVRSGDQSGHITGTYGLPAGRVEGEEDERERARIELEEETGLQIQVSSLIDYPNNIYFADIPRKSGQIVTFRWRVFICQQFTGNLRTTEETTPEWKGVNELPELNLLPNVSNAVNAGRVFLTSQNA